MRKSSISYHFSRRLKALRLKEGLTQTQMSERLKLMRYMISHFETQRKLPNVLTLVKIATHFNVTTDYLLGMDQRDDR